MWISADVCHQRGLATTLRLQSESSCVNASSTRLFGIGKLDSHPRRKRGSDAPHVNVWHRDACGIPAPEIAKNDFSSGRSGARRASRASRY